MKHNKKRNTAFLYESLLKELTKSILRKEKDKKQQIISILKEFFYKNSILKQDLDLYKSLLDNKKMTKDFAQRFLVEIKKDFHNIDRKAVFNEQTKLINKINKTLSKGAFSNFVPNYKDIASVGQFLNSDLKAKNRILVENRILTKLISDKSKTKEMQHVDNLTYNTFIKKFNESYGNSLRQEQKDLLNNYIVSFSDNGLGLKSFLNDEILRLKEEVSKCTKKQKIVENGSLLVKTKHVLKQLEEYSKAPITEKMVKEIFYIQDLVVEINSKWQ